MQKYHDEPRQYKGYLKNALDPRELGVRLYRVSVRPTPEPSGSLRGESSPAATAPPRRADGPSISRGGRVEGLIYARCAVRPERGHTAATITRVDLS